MKVLSKKAEYNMEKSGDGYVFSVKDESALCKVKIDYLSGKGAILFYKEISENGISACHLKDAAEDLAYGAVTEILRELL